jgi:hypothetical protein
MVKKKTIEIKSEIKDIFQGEYISIWEDEDLVFVSFPWVTMNFPKEEYEKIKAAENNCK